MEEMHKEECSVWKGPKLKCDCGKSEIAPEPAEGQFCFDGINYVFEKEPSGNSQMICEIRGEGAGLFDRNAKLVVDALNGQKDYRDRWEKLKDWLQNWSYDKREILTAEQVTKKLFDDMVEKFVELEKE